MRLFVGGGQDYYGPTSDRDKQVVLEVAEQLFESVGDSVEIVTGGMPGIPEDFAKAWKGTKVLCVVSSEQEEAFKSRNLPFDMRVIGESQLKRRLAVTKLENIKCALFVQGGKYSTHELQLFSERPDVNVVCFTGSGGAAGGTQPYEGWTYDTKLQENSIISSNDPNLDPSKIAKEIVIQIKQICGF